MATPRTGAHRALIARLAGEELDAFAAHHTRALDENPEGRELLGAAFERAVGAGFEAHGAPPAAVDDERAWARLRTELEVGLEGGGRRWRRRLEEAGRAEALTEAEETVLAAGEELDLTGAAGGLGGRGALKRAGREAAEAGAALAECLGEAEDAPAAEAPGAAPTAAVPRAEADGSVRVATAANQAETELIQERLRAAGIPSSWRRAGGDLPHLMAGGYRDIYVPGTAASSALDLLAEVWLPDEPEPPASQAVGLERRWLRLIGKLAAALIVGASLFGVLAFLPLSEGLAAAAALAAVAAMIGLVAWSERAGALR
jgi:hypothetical protein